MKKEKCCVNGCELDADYKVFLYDFYDYGAGDSEVFYQQDKTCPYLCEYHMQENEQRAMVFGGSRGFTRYPYSNRGLSKGTTKYERIRK